MIASMMTIPSSNTRPQPTAVIDSVTVENSGGADE